MTSYVIGVASHNDQTNNCCYAAFYLNQMCTFIYLLLIFSEFTFQYIFSCCGDCYSFVPIAMSLIALFLVLGTIFGVGIRWHQMAEEINQLRMEVCAYNASG